MRRRHKIVMSAVASVMPLAGWLAFVPAATAGVAPVDNSQDTVICTTVTKGIIKVTPPLLIPGGATSTTISISGTLGGCSSPSRGSLVFPEGKSKFKGTINGTTNSCLALAGPTTGTGTVTFSWGATDTGHACSGGPTPGKACNVTADCGAGGTCVAGTGGGLAQKTSTLTLPTGAAVGGTFNSPTQPPAGYGQFVVGTANGVAVAPSVAGGFQGGNSGATSVATIVTTQSVGTALSFCLGKGLKQLNIGTSAIELE
jgi:hypothetical protein